MVSTVYIPMSSLIGSVTFVLATIFYFALRYVTDNPKVLVLMPWVYLILMTLINIIFNITTMNSLCGSANLTMILTSTILPWLLIFGVLVAMLNAFSGWKAPFSNTIGFLVVGSQAKKLMSQILVNRETQNKDIAQSLEYIYNDQSALLNEFTPDNFDTVFDKMQQSGIFQSNVNEYKESLRKLVKVKDLIALGIWYLLAGFLVQTYGYYTIVSNGCQKTTGRMKKNEQTYLNSLKEETNKQKKKVYVKQ